MGACSLPSRRLPGVGAAAAVALSAAFAAPPAGAHHLWLQPTRFAGEPGTPVAVELRIGDGMPGEPVGSPPGAVRLVLLTAAGERPVPAPAVPGPAALLPLAPGGDQALVMTTAASLLELPAERFEAYLAEEGLEEVSRRRAAEGRSAEPGREAWSRSLKLLLRAGGPGPDTLHTRPTGLPLELVPEASPFDLAAGEELSFTLLWRGRPLAGARVVAVSPQAPEAVYSRSDAGGRVRYQFPSPGLWRLTAVHMEPAGRPDADWESVWSALTFSIGG